MNSNMNMKQANAATNTDFHLQPRDVWLVADRKENLPEKSYKCK